MHNSQEYSSFNLPSIACLAFYLFGFSYNGANSSKLANLVAKHF